MIFRDPTAKASIELRRNFLRMLNAAVVRVADSMEKNRDLDEHAFTVVSRFMPKELPKTFIEAPEDFDSSSATIEEHIIHSMLGTGLSIEDASSLAREMAAAQKDIRNHSLLDRLHQLESHVTKTINGSADPPSNEIEPFS